MQRERRKLNQAGMTLVELIVVILILGILSGGAAVGISYVSRMNSTSAAEKLVSLLERTRIYTISTEDTGGADKVSLVLTKEDNTYYGILMNGVTEVDKVSLGNGSLTIKVTKRVLNGEGTEVDDTRAVTNASGGSYEISYKKANGAFTEKFKQIEISGSKTRYIQMVHTTGRAYLK